MSRSRGAVTHSITTVFSATTQNISSTYSIYNHTSYRGKVAATVPVYFNIFKYFQFHKHTQQHIIIFEKESSSRSSGKIIFVRHRELLLRRRGVVVVKTLEIRSEKPTVGDSQEGRGAAQSDVCVLSTLRVVKIHFYL